MHRKTKLTNAVSVGALRLFLCKVKHLSDSDNQFNVVIFFSCPARYQMTHPLCLFSCIIRIHKTNLKTLL